MKKTLHAVFDGEVLRPQGPVDLRVNGRYLLTVEPSGEEQAAASEEAQENLADYLASLAVHTGIPDLAHQHDHYLYGTPKRGDSCESRHS